MGMFDIIVVKDSLPWTDEMRAEGLPDACLDFQTKDLANCLANYKIEGGKLLEQKFKTEKWVESNPTKEDPFDTGHIVQEGEYWEEIPYHGLLSFHDYNQSNILGGNDCFIEFQAVFTKGIIEKIVILNFEKSNNTDRIKKWNDAIKESDAIRNRPINKYFINTKPVRYARHCLHRALYDTGKFLTKLSYEL